MRDVEMAKAMQGIVDHSQDTCSTIQLCTKDGRLVEAQLEWKFRYGHGGASQTRTLLAHV